jgi:molybdate transport system regulatory protein
MFGDKPGWSVGFRVWIQRAGRPVLGPGRVNLLEEIDRLHSIRAAAAHMGMSYRRAWGLVRSMNEAAGEPLVELMTGGRGGGGANLTQLGREAITLFRSLSKQIAHATGDANSS